MHLIRHTRNAMTISITWPGTNDVINNSLDNHIVLYVLMNTSFAILKILFENR